MKKSWLIGALLIVCLFCGCSKTRNSTMRGELFYNPYMQKLVVYDHISKELSLFDNTKNQFQFWVDGSDNLFINSNSVTNESCLVQVLPSKLIELYRFNKNEGIFPIGMLSDKLYFIHSFYDRSGKEEINRRCISIIDINTFEIQTYSQVNGLISYGCINDESVFYTLYDNEQKDYTVMSVKTGDITAMPNLIYQSVNDGVVMMNGEKLFYSDGRFLISDKDKYEAKSENLIYQKLLVQLFVNSEGLLCIKVTHTETKNAYEEEDICGIRFDKNSLLICSREGVITYEP